MTPPTDAHTALEVDPDLAASCRAAVAAADREHNPLAMLAVAILFGFLFLATGTLIWLRMSVMPAVAAPVTLITALAPAKKLITKTAAPPPAAKPATAPTSTPR